MQRIEVPGMGIVEFPDGMSDADMTAAIQRSVQSAPAQPEGSSEGMAESMLIAAGRGTDKLVQGVRQAYNWATNDQATLAKMAEDEAEKDRLYRPLQDKYPVATAIAETAPMLAVPMGAPAHLVAKGAVAGALPGLVGYGSAQDRMRNGLTGAVGGAAGAGLGLAASRILKPAGVGAASVSDDAMQAAQRIGFTPTAGQRTQNPAMLNFENYLARSPGSSGVMQRVNDANQTALNRAGARAMGETADALDEGVFASAQGRIGGEFDRLAQITKPDLTGNFLNVLAKIDGDNSARGSFASPKIRDLVDKGLDLAAKNNLDGKAYKEIRTELSNLAQSSFKSGDATTGQAYKSLVSALDDAAKGSLSKADQQAWDVARKQWQAFKTLTKSNVAEGGNLSGPRAAAAVRAQGPALRTGRASGELADVARVGEAFKSVPNPNSGNLVQQMVYGNPITGLPMMLGNRAAAAAYMSPLGQRYMAQGLLDVGPTGQKLLTRGGGVLSVPAMRGLLGVE